MFGNENLMVFCTNCGEHFPEFDLLEDSETGAEKCPFCGSSYHLMDELPQFPEQMSRNCTIITL